LSEELSLALELGQFDTLGLVLRQCRGCDPHIADYALRLALTVVLQPLFVLCPGRRREDKQADSAGEQNIGSFSHLAMPPNTVDYLVGPQAHFVLAVQVKTLIRRERYSLFLFF
jgi:hypothetical protein